MKSRKIYLLFLTIILSMFLFACNGLNSSNSGKNIDFATNASDVLVNSMHSDTLSFEVALFSNKKISKVEYIGVEGTNIDSEDFKVNIFDNNIEELNDYKYKGLYIKYLMLDFDRTSKVENCEIEKIILNVDGETRKVAFPTPLKHEFNGGNIFTEELQIAVIPNELGASLINNNDQSVVYEFLATEDVSIKKIYFKDFIEVTNASYSIDDVDLEGSKLPIDLKKGEHIKIDISFTSKEAIPSSYVLTNLFFDYSTSSGEELCNSVMVFFDPVYPLAHDDFSNIDKLIDRVISQQ